MYDWPEARALVDAQWAALRERLLAHGIEAPETLVRCNGDMPPLPDGIRDTGGKVIAVDPAMLVPEALDLQTLWKHPDLLFAQTCWGPMEQGLAEHVVVVGQPDYSDFEGGEGELYSSVILMRRGTDDGDGVASPDDGRASLPLERMRRTRLAYNDPASMSGVFALTRDLEAIGESLGLFSEQLETGGHRASIVAVASGKADLCAIDCRSWHLARRYEPRSAELRAVGWTARRKGLPYITSRHTPVDLVTRLRAALA